MGSHHSCRDSYNTNPASKAQGTPPSDRLLELENQEVCCKIGSLRNYREVISKISQLYGFLNEIWIRTTPFGVAKVEGEISKDPTHKQRIAKDCWKREDSSFPEMYPLNGYLIPSGQPRNHIHTINTKVTQQTLFRYLHTNNDDEMKRSWIWGELWATWEGLKRQDMGETGGKKEKGGNDIFELKL